MEKQVLIFTAHVREYQRRTGALPLFALRHPASSTAPQLQEFIGGAMRDRTADLLHAMQALSQLSYSPTAGARILRTPPDSVKTILKLF